MRPGWGSVTLGVRRYRVEVIMANALDYEDAFIAGFKQGYAEGRVGQNTASLVEANARTKYQSWSEERQKVQSPRAFGAVIPVTGVRAEQKKK
jgi:hypothetical protein